MLVILNNISTMFQQGYHNQNHNYQQEIEERLSPLSTDSDTYQLPLDYNMVHCVQRHHTPPPLPIYSPGGAIYGPPQNHHNTYQMNHSPPPGYSAYHPHPSPYPYGYCYGPPGPYYSDLSTVEQSFIEHHRASLSSYNYSSRSRSFDTSGSLSDRRHYARGGRQRHGSSRHNDKPHRHYHGRGGSPPTSWNHFDANTTLYQIEGRIVEIARDRDGSKFIQRRLQEADPLEMQVAYDEAMVDIEKLWDDIFGNYILQYMLDFGTKDMRDGICDKIVCDGKVVELSTKLYGCRLIQKALETLDKEDVANIITSIKGNVYLLAHDDNGNHVIQRSIIKINELVAKQTVPFQNHNDSQDQNKEQEEYEVVTTSLTNALNIIIDEVTSSIQDFTAHKYGCRVVQRLIEHCRDEQREKVLDCISDEDLPSSLIDHEYGNYVIQCMLACGRLCDKATVFKTITNDVIKLSMQKHSSNVVQMMFTYGDVAQRHQIVEEILNASYESKNAALSMATDAYANYVLRTAMDVLEECSLKKRLFSVLISDIEALEHCQFAKKVVLRVKAYTNQETSNE